MEEKNIFEKEAIIIFEKESTNRYQQLSSQDDFFDDLNMASDDIDIEPNFLHGTIDQPYQKPDYLDLENDYLWSEYDAYQNRKYWEDKVTKEIESEEFQAMEEDIESDLGFVSADNIMRYFEEFVNSDNQHMFADKFLHKMLDSVTNHKSKKWYRLTPIQKLSEKVMQQELFIEYLFQHVVSVKLKLDKLSNTNNPLFTHPKQNEMNIKHTVNQLHKGLIENTQTLSKFTKYESDIEWLHKRNNGLSETSLE